MATKKNIRSARVSAPASAVHPIHMRVTRHSHEVRNELEPIFGSSGFNATSWELNALVVAVSQGCVYGQDLVLRAMALRGIFEEQTVDTYDDDDTIF